MAAPEAPRRPLRAGILLPGLVALLALADAGTRLVPLRSLAFRPWEAVLAPRGLGAPFFPGRRVEGYTVGDLANLGGVPFPADRRLEVFTSDSRGFRNSGNVAGDGPMGAVVFGDSFIAGGGLSDDDTFPARLREASGIRVFNAGGMPVWSRERLEEVLRIAGLEAGGAVVYALTEPTLLPFAPDARRSGPSPGSSPVPDTGEDLRVSRVGILARRFGSVLAGLARLSPGGGVVRRPLANGDEMLFLGARVAASEPVAEGAARSWADLRGTLETRGIGLVVLLIPAKDYVYGDLLSEPLPPRPPSAGPAIAEALAAQGVGVLDLAPVLKSAAREGLAARRYVFWRDDTHWSPLGVRISAAELARALPAARPGSGEPGPIPQRSSGR